MAIGLATSALNVIDKVLSMGLIKMDEKYTKKYYDLNKSLNNERKKEKKDRDHNLIVQLEDEMELLLKHFERQIEKGRKASVG